MAGGVGVSPEQFLEDGAEDGRQQVAVVDGGGDAEQCHDGAHRHVDASVHVGVGAAATAVGRSPSRSELQRHVLR